MVAIKKRSGKIRNIMSECFEQLKKSLKKLPGFGPKSAENTALYLALENKEAAKSLAAAITTAIEKITPAPSAADCRKTAKYAQSAPTLRAIRRRCVSWKNRST